MSTNERPPLWRAMDCAFTGEALSPYPEPIHQVFRDGYAAMIRAVADTAEQHFVEHGGTWTDVVEWLRCQAQIAEAEQ